MLPIAGPRRERITITTTATNTRMRAYSTRPWPFSLGANNMAFTSYVVYYLQGLCVPVRLLLIITKK